MKEEKFKAIQYIRELILALDKELENFPKKDIEIKNRIRKNCYDILEIAYEANSIISISDKRELLVRIIAKLKVIDFLINISLDKNIITEKKYLKLGNRLNDITKYINGWAKKITT